MENIISENISIAADEKRKKRNKRITRVKNQVPLFLMTLPGIVVVFLFSYMTMFGLILAFKNVDFRLGIFASPWCGLKNFEYLIKSKDLFIILRNTIGYQLLFHISGLIIGVALAIVLTIMRNKRTSRTYQTFLILPHFLSMVIVSYLVLAFLNMESGFLNKIIVFLGGKTINWYVEPKWWPIILFVVNTWKEAAFGSIIFISTISGIDNTLYEAASIDGANGRQLIWNITIPMLRIMICIKLILSLAQILGGDFGLFYQVPMNSGAIANVTTTIPVYVYKNLSSGGPRALGIASATSFIQSIVGCVLVITTNCIVKKIDPDSSLF